MKSIKYWLLLSIVLFICLDLTGQERQIVIPQQIEESIRGKKRVEDVSFYIYPHISNHIDVKHIKNIYPKLVIDDYVDIITPDLSRYGTTNLLMAVIQTSRDELKLVIWIVANYNTNYITFFIDETLDRSYVNDPAPVLILAGAEPHPISIYPYGKEDVVQSLNLAIPERKYSRKAKKITSLKPKVKLRNKFAIGVNASVGIAALKYTYDNNVTGFPAWYDVNLMEKQIGLNATYYHPSFKVGLLALYQNVFQYTSTFNVRIDNPEIIRVGNQRITRTNVDVATNRDQHSKNRLQLGLQLAYRMHIGPSIEIQPLVGYGITNFLSNEYVVNKFDDDLLPFNHSNDKYWETGIQFEFATGVYKAMSLGFVYRSLDWSPDGYYESFDGTNLNKSYNSWNMTIGYTIGL